MFLWKKYLKNVLLVFGIVLWVGALSPEIFIQAGAGCILDENGEALTDEEAQEFMESYFYGNAADDADTTVEIKYKFALLELFK